MQAASRLRASAGCHGIDGVSQSKSGLLCSEKRSENCALHFPVLPSLFICRVRRVACEASTHGYTDSFFRARKQIQIPFFLLVLPSYLRFANVPIVVLPLAARPPAELNVGRPAALYNHAVSAMHAETLVSLQRLPSGACGGALLLCACSHMEHFICCPFVHF